MKDVLDRWVAREGRLSQLGYVLTFTLPFLATLGLTVAMFTAPNMFGALGPVGIYGLAFGWLLLMAVGDALNIKRYHDLGHSGRLYRLCRPGVVVLPLLAFVMDFFIPAQLASAGDMEATLYLIGESLAPTIDPVPLALLVITVAGVAVNVGYLSLMPGQDGPNEYGPSPLGGAASPGIVPGARGQSSESDPVKRALADYQARQQAAARLPVASARPAAGGTFGKKR